MDGFLFYRGRRTAVGHRERVRHAFYDSQKRSGDPQKQSTVFVSEVGLCLLGIQRKTQAALLPQHTHLLRNLGHARGRSPARCETARVALEGPDENERFCIRSWAVFCSKYNEKHKLHTLHGTPTCPHTSATPGAGHPRAGRPPGTYCRAQTRCSSFVSEIWSFVSENECISLVLEVG